jgi:hypothetical protein
MMQVVPFIGAFGPVRGVRPWDSPVPEANTFEAVSTRKYFVGWGSVLWDGVL